jgi:hypothetical protein
MVMEKYSSSSSLSSLFAYGHLATKCHILPQLKHLMGGLPLYFPGPPFHFLTNCVSSISYSKLEKSLNLSS